MYLVITDGDLTADFSTGATNYYLMEPGNFTPQVSVLKTSAIGGHRFTDVIESWSIGVKGTSPPNCSFHMNTLATLLNRADQWAQGAPIAPVLIKYKPEDSDLTDPLETLILGRDGETPFLQFTLNFERRRKQSFLKHITMTFKRRGPWFGDEDTAASTALQHPAILSLTLPSVDNYSPTRFTLSRYKEQTDWSHLLISEETSGIVIENAEDCDNAGDYTTFNIAAGADVLRFTASDTDWSLSDGLEADLNFPFGVTLYHVFGNAKVGKAADSALVKIRSEYDYNTDYRETKPVSVGSTSVKWLYFGVLPVMAEAHYGKIKFEIKGNAIGAIVDIDNLVFAKIGSSVISTKYASNFASHWPDLNINHHTLSKRGGDVTVDMAGVDVNVTYKGSSPTIYTKNDVIYGMWLAADGGFWIPNVLRNNVLTATRTTTFLIPQ